MNWKRIIFAILILILVAVAGGLFVIKRTLQTPNGDIKENTIIKIESGTSISGVADLLVSSNLIKNKTLYIYSTKFFGKKINAGFYEVLANSSMVDIINLIDSAKIKLVKVTIPEGWRSEQVAEKLDELKILSYADFVREALPQEGKIFPDTFYMNPRMTAGEAVKMMTDDYDERTAGLDVSNDALVLASIVEREAADDTDRGIIAGIYSNRIKAGMKLQSDPTVEYGRDTNNIADLSTTEKMAYSFWKSAKTVEFTSVVSPFNTYQIDGLPPKPICNPGLKSIEAALNPTPSNYFFFLYGTDGKIHPSKTRAEHEAAVSKYMN